MRILFLSPVGVIGGAERVLLTAIGGLLRVQPGIAIRVIAPEDGPLLEAVSAIGAETKIVPMPSALTQLGDSQLRSTRKLRSLVKLLGLSAWGSISAWDYLLRLRAAIELFQPDLVHSNGIKTHLLSRFAVSRQTPVVWHLHDFFGLRPVAAELLRLARGRVRAGIAISQAVAIDATKIIPGVPIRTILNAVDLNRFSPGPGEDLDRLAGLAPAPPGTVRVGLVATYARWKGHLTFLDAAQMLAKSAPALPVRWYIVGGPIYQTVAQFSELELRTQVEARGIQDLVGFIPFQRAPEAIYRSLEIVVHASTLPEPFGLTIAEAMSCGRAVVVSAAGGAAELFTEGIDGLGVKPGDAAGLAAAVRGLVENPSDLDRLGSAARASALASFDDQKYASQLLELYRQLPNGKRISH